ncbi:MAG: class I SAM-dependent methyltransferase [Acidobacteria bacterium]|nr:class I SAM-dependent methyltransferase [Acidobacteriota bacterium]
MQAKDFEDLYETEEKMWWFAGMREISAALLDGLCRSDCARILDDGCGTGLNLEWLRRYGEPAAISGLDVERVALGFCRARSDAALFQASATDLPLAADAFDLVTSFDVLVQIPGDGADERALAEMFRVLKPGGLVLVRVAAYKWMFSGHDRAIDTQRRYTLPELAAKLEAAGFTVLRRTYANTILFPVAVIRRLVLKRIGLADEHSDVKPFPPALDWLNRLFTRILFAEARYLKKRSLPFGLSAVCVARKD